MEKFPKFAPQPPSKLSKDEESKAIQREIAQYIHDGGTIKVYKNTPQKLIVLNSNGKLITTPSEAKKRRRDHKRNWNESKWRGDDE